MATFDFSGKVAAITGGTKGIGRAIAEKFLDAGAMAAVCSRREADVLAAIEELGRNGRERVFGAPADTSTPDGVASFLAKTIERFGRIDIMVNNAGVQFPQPTLDMPERDFDATFDTNVKGYYFASQFAARDMIRRGQPGCIVNIGSVNAVTVVVGQAAYAATKAAISQMTKSMAREWGKQGIRVNCVAPGSFPTNINAAIYADRAVEIAMEEKIPLGRRGRLGEAADAVLFLASDYASYVTGQTLFVDGGLTLVHG